MKTFTYDNDRFLLNGEPYTVISGAMHYFRIHPDSWEDRLKKLKACGFNTVETYAAWNLHERREGQFDFSGMLDIERFISIAASLNLNVILRPGPYICAEWEFGGFPSWLLSYPNIHLRCNDPLYLSKVEPYFKELLARIRPHLCTNGGNVIMVQVENEYGSYGNDKDYLRRIVEIYKDCGIDCMLFTSDGPYEEWMLAGGSLPEVLETANFGSKAKEKLLLLQDFQPDRPLMCAEYWCGWFEHWYEDHYVQRAPDDILANLGDMFDLGASFNFYMFHGGTNFGFTNGANHTETLYQPTVTSYDYTAPLNEAGDMTPNYYAVKDFLERKTGVKAPSLDVADSKKAAYGRIALTERADLFENLVNLTVLTQAANPKTMEEVGQDFGYILYRTTLRGPFHDMPLKATIHDRAIFFLNGNRLGVWERTRREDPITLSLEAGETAQLDILVENMGRVNYGPLLMDRKGIIGGVRIGRQFHFGWEMYPLTMESLCRLAYGDAADGNPAFYRGTFTIDGEPCDTFVRADGFTKGFVTVNGFNLGRYYNPAGPQKSLYVPAAVLREGENEIIVFETDGCSGAAVRFDDKPTF